MSIYNNTYDIILSDKIINQYGHENDLKYPPQIEIDVSFLIQSVHFYGICKKLSKKSDIITMTCCDNNIYMSTDDIKIPLKVLEVKNDNISFIKRYMAKEIFMFSRLTNVYDNVLVNFNKNGLLCIEHTNTFSRLVCCFSNIN
jgi:hypothetical protein